MLTPILTSVALVALIVTCWAIGRRRRRREAQASPWGQILCRPLWVVSDNPSVEASLADYFGCRRGRP